MTEVELAKALRKSNYTCEGVDCEECKKTNSIHQCLMRDVQVYCDDILGADDNYIEKLEKENKELKNLIEIQYKENQTLGNNNTKLFDKIENLKILIEKMKCCENCYKMNGCNVCYACKRWNNTNADDFWEMRK